MKARLRHVLETSLIALVVAAAAACGNADHGETLGSTLQPGDHRTRAQRASQSCGADRYQGPQGVDVSYYQPNFDWQAAASDGVVFGFARVSDGLSVVDDKFQRHWQGMEANGIIRGAYQFFRPSEDAAKQARLMVDKVGELGDGELPCVLDLERDEGIEPAQIASKLRTWLEIVERGTGKTPIIYTTASFWESEVDSTDFSKYPLWAAHWGTTCPSVPRGWNDWTFWQYCNGDPQYCSNGEGFDRNVFDGSTSELESFADGGTANYAAEFVEQSFPLASTAMEMEAGETKSGYIELRNTGEKEWNSETHLATTEPRDRESAFANQSWLNPSRPAAVEGTVPPGETYRFEVELQAPDDPGVHSEHFGVVQEQVVWFSEQGGPPDDLLEVKIRVSEGSRGGDAGIDAGDDAASSERDVADDGDATAAVPSNPDADENSEAPNQPGNGSMEEDDNLGSMVHRSSSSTRSGCTVAGRTGPIPLPATVLLLTAICGLFLFGRRADRYRV